MKFRKRSLLSLACIATAVMITGCGNLSSEDEKTNDKVSVQYSHEKVDSLFSELIERTEIMIENEDNYEATSQLDFASLATGLEPYAADGDMKASVGYVVAEMMSLNASSSLKKVADSLDAYFSNLYDGDVVEATEEVLVSETSRASTNRQRGNRIRGIASTLFSKRKNENFFGNSYSRNGVNGLSTALIVRTPEIILSRAETPSWPSFLTVSYIQNVIDNEITPRLNKVIAVLERVEENSYDESLVITVDGESVEIDVADFYLLDASINALKSSLLLFTSYNWDIYAPNSNSYSWIDSLVTMEENNSCYDYDIYTLRNDTLVETNYHTHTNDKKLYEFTYDLLKYNMGRSDFAALKSNNLSESYNALLAVPNKIEKALIALENETDDQNNDLIPNMEITNLKEDMIDIPAELEAEGISPELAANFRTPKALAQFAKDILSGPYQFKESIQVEDDYGNVIGNASFDITVDISRFYTNPIQDLKSVLPYYKFRDKADIVETSMNQSGGYNNYSSTTFYLNSNDSVDIDPSRISETGTDEYGYTYVELVQPYSYYQFEYQNEYFVPFDFTDANHNVISWDSLETMLFEDGEFFYLPDYTINGIFPGMTRDKWNANLKELLEL